MSYLKLEAVANDVYRSGHSNGSEDSPDLCLIPGNIGLRNDDLWIMWVLETLDDGA